MHVRKLWSQMRNNLYTFQHEKSAKVGTRREWSTAKKSAQILKYKQVIHSVSSLSHGEWRGALKLAFALALADKIPNKSTLKYVIISLSQGLPGVMVYPRNNLNEYSSSGRVLV